MKRRFDPKKSAVPLVDSKVNTTAKTSMPDPERT